VVARRARVAALEKCMIGFGAKVTSLIFVSKEFIIRSQMGDKNNSDRGRDALHTSGVFDYTYCDLAVV
jgi:hypothetical protein